MVNVDFKLVEHGGVNIKEEDNVVMEEYDLEAKNIIVDVGICVTDNVLENRIEEDVTGSTNEYDEDDDSGTHNYDDDEENLDIPLIEKAYETLYKGSQTTLLSIVLLLVKFKVMNGISNVASSRTLRYRVISIIYYVSVPLVFFI